MELFITWAKRQVKDSRRSGISNVPKLLFYGDRIGHSKSVRFRLSRPFDEVRAELV